MDCQNSYRTVQIIVVVNTLVNTRDSLIFTNVRTFLIVRSSRFCDVQDSGLFEC